MTEQRLITNPNSQNFITSLQKSVPVSQLDTNNFSLSLADQPNYTESLISSFRIGSRLVKKGYGWPCFYREATTDGSDTTVMGTNRRT